MEAKEFGIYIRKLRKERSLTIRQVEKYSGVSNSYLSQIENGMRGIPKPNILEKISKALKVPYEELMEKAGYLKDDSERQSVPDYINSYTLDQIIKKYNVDLSDPSKRKQFEKIIQIVWGSENDKSSDV